MSWTLERSGAQAAHEAMNARVVVPQAPTNVKLNVGGHVFKTSVNTLAAVRGSVLADLAALFSSSGYTTTLDEDGAYFIDRDGTHFRHILNYLRGCFDVSTLVAGARRELLCPLGHVQRIWI